MLPSRFLSLRLVCAALICAVGLATAAPAAQARSSRHKRPLAAAVAGPLPPPVAAALARAHVPLSAISVVIERIGDPQPLVALNATQPMSPASTMKLVTTFAGLSILGPDYRWKTDAYADGAVTPDGTLHGNLYLVGHGDPKLVPEELTDLVARIRKAGIVAIDGDLVLDKGYFDASTRDAPPLDDNVDAPYNVGPDPLLYAFKSLSFTLEPDAGDGSVTIDALPPLAQLQIVNDLRATSGPCVGALRAAVPDVTPEADGIVQAVFTGDYPMRCGERSVNLAVLDHSAFFAGGFLALWKEAGGAFAGRIREGATPADARWIATHHGPALMDIVRDINKFSNNVMARNLFLTIGAVAGRPPSTAAGSAQAIEKWLAQDKLPTAGLVLDNGSGLSRDERITALSLADLLQAANESPVAQPFVESLPIAGVDGTMRHRLTGAPVGGNAQIKTGTLADVRAIAGYVAAANGERYVVVSFINDPHAENARDVHDRLLEWVYQHGG